MDNAATTEATLQAHIQALRDLLTRIPSLRALPGHLVKAPGQQAAAGAQAARGAFKEIAEVRGMLVGADVQGALNAARESERKDGGGLSLDGRRESRKKRKIAAVDSPSPYPLFHRKVTRTFPDEGRARVTARSLPAYVREQNAAANSAVKLHIWGQARRGGVSSPVVVRASVRDVVTVFIKLTYVDDVRDALVVESAAAFGPREKKGPHSQSDYAVYQKVTQQVTRMVESEPTVTLGQVVLLVSSYSGLFVGRCKECGRVLSAEGHVPAVGREWIEGEWIARHV